jgi:hypothetical protein
MTACPPTWGPQRWSTFRKLVFRNGTEAGAAPAGPTIGLHARATTREPRRSGLCRLRKQQGEGLAAPSTFRHGRTRSGLYRELSRFRPLAPEPHCRQINRQSSSLLRRRSKVRSRSDQFCPRSPPELARLTGKGRCGRSLQPMKRSTKMRPMTSKKVQHCRGRSSGRAREW